MTRPTRFLLLGLVTAFALGAASPASAAADSAPTAQSVAQGQQRVEARWLGLVPCIITAYNPATNYTRCTGSTAWIGTWTGVTHYVFRGKLDAVTFTGHGKIQERFFGADSHGRVGTMRFEETITAVPSRIPATGLIRIDVKMVGATGGFRGATGHVLFTGLANAAIAFGTFHGWWTPPPG
jgi:hypothetical protein